MSFAENAQAIGVALTPVAVIAGVFVTYRGQRRIRSDVAGVQTQVETANGNTLAALADQAEGRRIAKDVPAAERDHSEQGYVDRLPDDPPSTNR